MLGWAPARRDAGERRERGAGDGAEMVGALRGGESGGLQPWVGGEGP